MRVLGTLAIVFVVQAHLMAAITPRTPELAWPQSEELPPPPLVIPTLTISTNDVDRSSIMVFRWPTRSETHATVAPPTDAGGSVPAPPVERKYSVKWAYSEAGARRVREFTEAHVGQRIQITIGTFSTPPALIVHPNRAGRDGMHGISEVNAKAILVGLGDSKNRGPNWWSR